jgi:hypothetical protein
MSALSQNPAHTFEKLLAAIDKNLEMVKQLPKGGYLPQ